MSISVQDRASGCGLSEGADHMKHGRDQLDGVVSFACACDYARPLRQEE